MRTKIIYLLAIVLVSCVNKELPDLTIKTTEVNNINSYSAICGGEIVSDDALPVLEKGVCWSLNQNPTYADNHTNESAGAGKFTSKITNLNADSTYYVRAYCINKFDTVYGNQMSFRTPNTIIFNSQVTYSTVTDIDGNVYKTVSIGSQTWMAENLRVTHFRNGDLISNETNLEKWGFFQIQTSAFCWYNNDVSNKNIYGALYNWYAASDNRNIAPEGWHVATREDWEKLENYMNPLRVYQSYCGNKLRETTTAHWRKSNGLFDNTNQTGFTALPAGKVAPLPYGFMEIGGDFAYFWTKTGTPNGSSCVYLYSEIVIDNLQPNCRGFSIRCVKD